MKVKEFIRTLQEFNPDANVILVNNYSGGTVQYDEIPGWNSPDLFEDPDPEVRKNNLKKMKMATNAVYFHLGRENNKEKENDK